MNDADRLNGVLTVAMGRCVTSLDTARQLTAAGFNGPAYVWAVRSVEIFMREFALLPYFLSSGRAFDEAWKKARRAFGGGGDWNQAMATVENACGEIDEMLTTDDEDAWAMWKRHIPQRRGECVHGRALSDPSDSEVEHVIEWARMLVQQLGLRLMTKPNHPASIVITEFMRRADLGTDPTNT